MTMPLSLSEISHVIALTMAPAFILVAVISFSSLMVGKMGTIVARIRHLNGIDKADQARAHLKADLPRLERCARLIGCSLAFAAGSGVVTAGLMVFAFLGALAKWQHEGAVAILFMVALTLLAVAFALLLWEAIIWYRRLDHHA